MSLQINEFDMNSFSFDHLNIAIIGVDNKYLIKSLMWFFNSSNIQYGIVISPMDKLNRVYIEYVPEEFIHHEYNDEILNRFTHRQRTLRDQNNSRSFLIIDDIKYESDQMKDSVLHSTILNRRCYKICPLIFATQLPLQIAPEIRSNFDYIFLSNVIDLDHKRKIYELYAGIFPTFEQFNEIFDRLTENNCYMVIINSSKSIKLEDNIFWFKPFTVPEFMFSV